MCILCPIKVLLPTSHVFNRFMFSICEASSHLQSCLLHVLLPPAGNLNRYHHLIVFVRKVPHNIQQTSMHFLDVPSWSHLVHLGIRDQKGRWLQKLIPGRIARLWWRIHLLVHTVCCAHNLRSRLSLLRILTTPQPAFHLYCHHSWSFCSSPPCTAIAEKK